MQAEQAGQGASGRQGISLVASLGLLWGLLCGLPWVLFGSLMLPSASEALWCFLGPLVTSSGTLLMASLGLSNHFCACLSFSGPLLASLGFSALLCASLGISLHIWASLRFSGYRLACLGFSGPLLASLGLAWLLWQALFRSHSSCTFLMLSQASLGFLR